MPAAAGAQYTSRHGFGYSIFEVSERGIAELQEGRLLDVTVKTGLKEDELLKLIGEFDGLVVRSQTKVNAKVLAAAKNLQVVGRAGVRGDDAGGEGAAQRGGGRGVVRRHS